ncbi:MAG: ComEC/Rec2 family competence protein, partial [Anaerolineae bacterium]
LLGVQSGIPRSLWDQFNATGTSHIIVISGSNITLIAALLMVLGRKLVGFQWAAPLAILGIGLYTLLVGADAAVSRAALMGALWVFAMWVGRPGAALNALVASAIIMTAANPLTLWDAGFQLSFAATLGLILFVPSLEAWTSGQLSRSLGDSGLRLALSLLREAVLVTLAATLMTTPIIIYHFGRFSLIGLIANLLVVPVQPLVMILGGLATAGGLVWPPLGQLLAWLVWPPLAWTVWVVETTARIPWASLELERMPLWAVLGSYVLLGLGVWWRHLRITNRQAALS